MPHNLYLHSALVLTRKVDPTRKRQVHEVNNYSNIDSAIALFISFIINTAVITTFASYGDLDEDRELDLQHAAVALENGIGEASKYIWALGLLAAGQSATMTGTYAGQFVMEGFLDFTLPVWQRVLLTRSIAIVPAFVVSFFLSARPGLLNGMDSFLNILQSIQLPFALIPLIKFVGSKKIMGDFAVSKGHIIFSTFFAVCLFLINFAFVFSAKIDWDWQHIVLMLLVTVCYLALVAIAIIEPTSELKWMTKEE